MQNSPDGQPTKPTNLSRMEPQRVRQRDTPWDIAAPLPPNVAALQELHYRGMRYDSYVGSTDLPPLETPIDRRFGVQERGTSWLLLERPAEKRWMNSATPRSEFNSPLKHKKPSRRILDQTEVR